MGDLCDESQPATLDYSHLEKFENPLLKSIPVIITAGSRTSYLYQSLKSYLRAWGVVKRNIHVLLGSNSSQTIDLLNLLNINFTYIQPSLDIRLQVLKYTSFNEYSLLRGNVQVGWGYIVTKNFIKEVLEVWPSTYISDTLVYDGWLYYYVIGERECIFPEVSRSLHFGVGLNTVYWLTEASFFSTPLHNATKRIEFTNLEKFMINPWSTDLRNKIIKSIPIKESPCRENFISALHPGSYVMFYNHTQNDETTYYNHAFIASCFRAWMFSNQGQHYSVKTIQATPDITFYLVAVPESSFSDLKPPDYIPIDIRSKNCVEYIGRSMGLNGDVKQ
ncbi:Protein O-linked-mannose beta-1,2-N-acetylglucosaminyltransferase 1 [Armadillidium vulgare]|nr:Protein O-linked-mannose beta-1,2-N-acetylglucosaminyltransferase 1 [Armadillidium vulgare]